MHRQCGATHKAGEPCSATHYRDGWCRWHHPDLEAQRQAERRAGGKAKANTARARKRVLTGGMELREVDAALCNALDDVLAGEIEPGVGSAAATIARSILAVRQIADIDTRLAALEATIDREGRA